ncbi:DUF2625 domain-containing protein [Paenibacillus alvei]|uniref:DUF2625 domain-containing protein n=2 Tax=Paenibacillus alvei TaxID=44250 RepID=A0ABT4GZG8_PAEAL|nr:DUF2625 family protein [Paenibacillus alvei]MCY9584689.1 DUF2625 domain-containing protein [Paenibacillus alvei]MCY9761811.1 DUF2625 domain-containing protein [Paenibacillus alvei]MCY9769853.1 DUF2625 domain-containing protein [Paenibacillus alvei]
MVHIAHSKSGRHRDGEKVIRTFYQQEYHVEEGNEIMNNAVNEQTWKEILQLFENGNNRINVLSADPVRGKNTGAILQVSERSYIGAIARHSGGVLVDGGWIKLLGSGNDAVFGDLLSWNGFGDDIGIMPLHGACMIAYDLAGGFFALNGGCFESEGNHVYYFAPDTLEWENTELLYSDFCEWLANGDLALFYRTFRWNGWEKDIAALKRNEAISYFPPLWTEEGSAEHSSRKAVPVADLWNSYIQSRNGMESEQ